MLCILADNQNGFAVIVFISKSDVQNLSLHERHQIMPSMFKLQPEYFGPVATTKPVAGHADIGRLLAGYERDQVFIGKTNGSSCRKSRPKPLIQPHSSTRATPCANAMRKANYALQNERTDLLDTTVSALL